jgi:hypothetical protein
MSGLRLIELQRVGYRLRHVLRNSAEVSALQAGVVVDAHSGHQRDFFPAQHWNPAVAAVRGQACLLWRNPGAPGGQEIPNVVPVVHDHDVICAGTLMGGSRITRINRDSECPATPDRS